jgi:hypothetical protein
MSEMMWVNFVLPVVMGVVGWLGSAYRSKQKKEGDILDNVQRIIDIQDAHIKKSEEALAKSENLNKRLEAKLDRKTKSVRAANKCKYTSEGDGCPVLNQEEKNEHCYGIDCASCTHNNDNKIQG